MLKTKNLIFVSLVSLLFHTYSFASPIIFTDYATWFKNIADTNGNSYVTGSLDFSSYTQDVGITDTLNTFDPNNHSNLNIDFSTDIANGLLAAYARIDTPNFEFLFDQYYTDNSSNPVQDNFLHLARYHSQNQAEIRFRVDEIDRFEALSFNWYNSSATDDVFSFFASSTDEKTGIATEEFLFSNLSSAGDSGFFGLITDKPFDTFIIRSAKGSIGSYGGIDNIAWKSIAVSETPMWALSSVAWLLLLALLYFKTPIFNRVHLKI